MLNSNQVRDHFPMTSKYIYLNAASNGLIPNVSINAMKEYVEAKLHDFKESDVMRNQCYEENRRLFAQLIGAKESEIALVSGTSIGLNQISQLIPLKPGSNVIINDMEYVSNVLVWLKLRKKGVEVRFVKNKNGVVAAHDIEKAADENTMVISVSNPGWYNGYLHDIKYLGEIVHRNGGYLVVDGIQGCGTMSIDVKREGVDFYVAGTHKKLLGPFTVAFLYIREELINRLEPAFLYLGSQPDELTKKNIYDAFDAYELNIREGIKRHDMYPAPEVDSVGAGASMRFLTDIGVDNIEAHIKKLSDHLIERLLELGVEFQTPLDPKLRFGNINFKVKNYRDWEKRMMKRNIVISVRISGVRVSPHCYNTIDEIDNLVEVTKELIK